MPTALWTRWKRIAHRAAVIQSAVLLAILYWVLVVPIGLVRRRRPPRGQGWHARSRGTRTLDEARRQF